MEGNNASVGPPIALNPMTETLLLNALFCELEDTSILDCLLYFVSMDDFYINFPSMEHNPLRYSWLLEAQQLEPELIQKYNNK